VDGRGHYYRDSLCSSLHVVCVGDNDNTHSLSMAGCPGLPFSGEVSSWREREEF
jgi:hypothetical protein